MKLEDIDKLLGALSPDPLLVHDNIVYIDGEKEIIRIANEDSIKGEIIFEIDYAQYHSQDVALAKLLTIAPTVIRELVERVRKLENGISEIDAMREMFPDDPLIVGLCDKAVGLLYKEST